MDEQEQQSMTRLGITSEERVVYLYKGNKYQLLKDAIRYAEIDQARTNPDKVPPGKV